MIVTHDEHTAWVQWGILGKQHCGSTESIHLNGCEMLIDRDKKGKVCAVEISPSFDNKKEKVKS